MKDYESGKKKLGICEKMNRVGLKSYVQLKSRMGTGNRKENIVSVEKVFLLSQNSRDPNAGSKMTHSVCV